MKFKIRNVDKENWYEDEKVKEFYKQILNKYDYQEDNKYSYITIETLDDLILLEKELTTLNEFNRGIIINNNIITIYDDYIE